mmetsp:Transcript_85092/g.264370  ORF Transcript_85092/g.264370 Transcript_85092/m.264370 type:complete len:241 (-) Transcript_85092:434-1156(-)
MGTCMPEPQSSPLTGGHRLLECRDQLRQSNLRVGCGCDEVGIALEGAEVWWAQCLSVPSTTRDDRKVPTHRRIGFMRSIASLRRASRKATPERVGPGQRDELFRGNVEIPDKEAWRSEPAARLGYRSNPLDCPAQRLQIVPVAHAAPLDLTRRMEVHRAEDRRLAVSLPPHEHRDVVPPRGRGASPRGDLQQRVLALHRPETAAGTQEECRGGVDLDPSAITVRPPLDEALGEVWPQGGT